MFDRVSSYIDCKINSKIIQYFSFFNFLPHTGSLSENGQGGKPPRSLLYLPPGGGTLYAAQTVCEDFHSSPGDGAFANLPQNENSYIMNLPRSEPGFFTYSSRYGIY
jgi:hypothetical protein